MEAPWKKGDECWVLYPGEDEPTKGVALSDEEMVNDSLRVQVQFEGGEPGWYVIQWLHRTEKDGKRAPLLRMLRLALSDVTEAERVLVLAKSRVAEIEASLAALDLV